MKRLFKRIFERPLECESCGCHIYSWEAKVLHDGMVFCSDECFSDYQEDNLGYAVQTELPIKYDKQQLVLEGI
jgi:hypothetical protein